LRAVKLWAVAPAAAAATPRKDLRLRGIPALSTLISGSAFRPAFMPWTVGRSAGLVWRCSRADHHLGSVGGAPAVEALRICAEVTSARKGGQEVTGISGNMRPRGNTECRVRVIDAPGALRRGTGRAGSPLTGKRSNGSSKRFDLQKAESRRSRRVCGSAVTTTRNSEMSRSGRPITR
jgi:hypothetical protein